jgi:hypothetical protein
MLQRKLYTLFLLFIAVKLIATEADPNLSYLQDYLRVRADLSGKETVYHFSGKVYSIIPEQKSMELFAVEGYNISRLKQVEAGYQLLAKEVIVFQDHRTKEILKRWRNPLTGQNLPVLHILNDPVNQSFVYEPHMLPYINHLIPSQNLGESIVYHNEIFPFYPHPLSQREYSAHVQSEYFQAVETYEYRVHKDALADSTLSSVPADYSWTWISPWLPFMRMADREGQLLFVTRGKKLKGGFIDLPKHIRGFVIAHHPDFAQAPEIWTEPNQNPWSYFKTLAEQANSDQRGSR